MSTLAELRDNVLALPLKGPQVRKKNIHPAEAEFWVKVVRNFLIGKDIEKGNFTLAAYEQDLGCWPLDSVDQADCPAYLWGQTVKRATFPRILELRENAGLTFFGLIDKRTRIYVPSGNYGILDDAMPYQPKRPRTGMMVGFDTIYVYGTPDFIDGLKVVNIRGIFEDPTLVSYYNETGQQYCYDKNKTQYPMPAVMEDAMYQIIEEKYILPFAKAPKQIENTEENAAVA